MMFWSVCLFERFPERYGFCINHPHRCHLLQLLLSSGKGAMDWVGKVMYNIKLGLFVIYVLLNRRLIWMDLRELTPGQSHSLLLKTLLHCNRIT